MSTLPIPQASSGLGPLAPPEVSRVAGIVREQIAAVRNPSLRRQLNGMSDAELVAFVRQEQPENYAQIVGSLAATLPPEGPVNWKPAAAYAASYLPAAASMAGSVIGGAGGTVAGLGVGSVPGAVIGATLGGAGGEALRQLLDRALGVQAGPQTTGQRLEQIGKQGAIQGTSEVVGQAIPLVAGPLMRSAEKSYHAFLDPKGLEMKAIAERVTPEMLRRPLQAIRFSRSGLENAAAQQLEDLGPAIDEEIARISTGRTKLKPHPYRVIQAVRRWQGKSKVGEVPVEQGAIDAGDAIIQVIQNVSKSLGKDISYRDLNEVRRIWDPIVARAGRYAGKDFSTVQIEARKVAADAIRNELAKASPDLAKINAEYTFWARLRDLAAGTRKRTIGKKELARLLMSSGLGPFSAFEFVRGNPREGALLLALAAIQYAVTTPFWRTSSAVAKSSIARALMNGDFKLAIRLASHIAMGALSHPERSQ